MVNPSRRGLLLGGVATAALAMALQPMPAEAMPGFLRKGAPVSGGGGGTVITTAAIANQSTSALTAPYVQFYQGFGRGDLTDGNVLAITDDLGGTVAYSAARRANWPDVTTNRSGVDLFCKLPHDIPGKIAISSLTISGSTATCTTAAAHGLSSGNQVLIQPQNTDTTVGNPSALYCGLVTVTVTGGSTFSYTVPGITPSGPAAVAMEMCYTRTLSFASAAGSWNDALPAGKTSTNILTDIQAHFDNITLELTDFADSTGTTVGSGVYSADFFTCIAQAGTDKLRVVATGPTVCDFTGIMKFADTVGGARHSTIAGWFYVSALLNPSTGAVVEIHARAFVDQSLVNTAMSYYTFRSRMKLGSTVVRSLGLSSNTAIDGKLQSFATTAVSTTTDQINIPGHGFQGGERVQLTTTGTLPAPFATGTDYAVIWVDGDNVKLTTTFIETNQQGTSTGLNITDQGTGTHTITCWQQSPYATRQAYVGKTGLPDRWTGAAGALSPISYHVIHDTNYMQRAKLIPPIDLTIALANPVAEISLAAQAKVYLKSRYVFGCPGIVVYAQNNGGAGGYHEYGTPFTDQPSRRARYPNDFGYCQTLRTTALGLGSFDLAYTRDDTNWRAPVTNNGPTRTGDTYPGMSASERSAQWFKNVAPAVFTAPSSYTKSPGLNSNFWSADHRYLLFYPLYMFEGRQEIHDIMVLDPLQFMLQTTPAGYTGPGTQVTSRWQTFGGVTYYSIMPGTQPRCDAWGISTLAYALALCDANAPELAVLKDYFSDTLAVVKHLILTDGATNDPDWLNFGSWSFADTMQRGPGAAFASNKDSVSVLFEGYIGMAFNNAYRIYPSADFQAVIGHFNKLPDNLYRAIHNCWFSNTFQLRGKRGVGTDTADSGKFVTDLTQPLMLDANLDALIFKSDGTVWGLYNAQFTPFTPPIQSEKHVVNLNSFANATPNLFSAIPPELTLDQLLYVRQPSGSYYGFKYATTDSDATIIGSYSVRSSSTISTTLGTGTTSIVTNDILTGFQSGNTVTSLGSLPLATVVITSGAGTEICAVTAGSGTTGLTIVRGRYGTTALAHGAGAAVYVPYMSFAWRDLQNRDVPFPPTGHGWRVPDGGGNAPVDGYRTIMRSAAGYGFINGIIPRTAFDNADAFFTDATETPALSGPGSFSLNNSLMDSINISL